MKTNRNMWIVVAAMGVAGLAQAGQIINVDFQPGSTGEGASTNFSGQGAILDPGNNVWRDDGAFRLVLHVERGGGIDDATVWADELAAIFRGKDLGGIIQTWAPSAPVTDDRNSAANYYVLSFAVPYWHDYLG